MGSFGAEALVSRYHPDAAILPERTDLDVTVEHGGFTWFELESQGVEAAGAEPEKGVDAIALLGPVLDGIVALDRKLDARPHASYGRGSIHASTIAGGTQLPAYPGVCRLGVERCLIAGESVDESRAEIEALLAAARAANRASPPPVVSWWVASPSRCAVTTRSCWRSSRPRPRSSTTRLACAATSAGPTGDLRRGRHTLRAVRPGRRWRAHGRRVGRRRIGQARGARAGGRRPALLRLRTEAAGRARRGQD